MENKTGMNLIWVTERSESFITELIARKAYEQPISNICILDLPVGPELKTSISFDIKTAVFTDKKTFNQNQEYP